MVPTDGRKLERIVIGVVRGTRYLAPEQEPGPEMFLPIRQGSDHAAAHLVVRGALPPSGLASTVGEALRPLDSRLPVNDVVVIQDVVSRSVSPRRLLVTLLTGFAGFSLVLASLGIYAVIAYSVAQRTSEIGVRLALGASALQVRRRILMETLELAAAGLAVGLPAAWLVGRTMKGLLFGVSAADPVTFTAVPLVLLTVAGLAGYLPALRASRLDPVQALATRR